MQIPTSPEVYAVLWARHRKDLELYSTASMPCGERLMETNWSLKGSELPFMGSRTTWDDGPGDARENVETVQYLFVPACEKDHE